LPELASELIELILLTDDELDVEQPWLWHCLFQEFELLETHSLWVFHVKRQVPNPKQLTNLENWFC